jgi:hypothetical protein
MKGTQRRILTCLTIGLGLALTGCGKNTDSNPKLQGPVDPAAVKRDAPVRAQPGAKTKSEGKQGANISTN